MLFAHDGDVKTALLNSIEASIAERKANACDTWDMASVLAHAWGVKEMVDPQHADAVEEYMTSVEGSNVKLESGEDVSILKAGIKKVKEQVVLIYRYQINM